MANDAIWLSEPYRCILSFIIIQTVLIQYVLVANKHRRQSEAEHDVSDDGSMALTTTDGCDAVWTSNIPNSLPPTEPTYLLPNVLLLLCTVHHTGNTKSERRSGSDDKETDDCFMIHSIHLQHYSSSVLPLTMLSSRLLPSRSVHRIIVRSFLAVEPEKIEYVHPLSQIVLEHLESTQSKFVTAHGLDRGLRLQRDGTFEIRFPSYEIDRARIWYVVLYCMQVVSNRCSLWRFPSF
jgi:hypothetical protein